MKRLGFEPRWLIIPAILVAVVVIGVVVIGVVVIGVVWLRDPEEDLRERIRSTADQASSSSAGHTSFTLPNSARTSQVDHQIDKLDPHRDGWESEVVSAAVKKQLGRLMTVVQSNSYADSAAVVADDFEGVVLRDDLLQLDFDDGICRVRRLPEGGVDAARTDSVQTQFNSMMGLSGPASVARCSVKIIGIELSTDEARTDVMMELLQTTDKSIEQSNAILRAVWLLGTGEQPRLRSLEIRAFEQISFSDPRPLMEDVTATVLGNTDSFDQQVLRDVGYWSERMTRIDDMHIYGHHGVAVGDVNQDGLDDLYVCDSGGLPNRLYIQQPDGTLSDQSARSRANWLESTTGAKLIDLDNDGDLDLVAATVAAILFASNDGSGVFQIRAARAGMPEAHSLCAADYDNDGDVDLYVPNYGSADSSSGQRGFEEAVPLPYNDANNGGRNALLANRGGFQFQDVTRQCGLDVNNRRWSFAASWEDFDADGDMDLYVANDFGRNNLYRNERGKFQDVAADLGVEDMAGGMSVSWADFNRDGRMDIYVGNMFSAAGNRITYQRQFVEGRSRKSSAGVQRMARGNTLFMANSDGTFADVSQEAGVTMGRWAWSSKFADLNNDGWQDLVVANGYFTNDNPDDL